MCSLHIDARLQYLIETVNGQEMHGKFIARERERGGGREGERERELDK